VFLLGETIIEIYMEHKRDRFIFHAHPSYNFFGEWYDWGWRWILLHQDDLDYSVNAEGGYIMIRAFTIL